jgi:squalene cyclase
MKIIGAGLPRTGTATLAAALRILGFDAIHHAPERLPLYPPAHPTPRYWQAYDDVDAVTDIPAAYWYQELIYAYPEAKLILTVRDADTWWESIKAHAYALRQSEDVDGTLYTDALHAMVYGSACPSEYLWKRRVYEHIVAVRQFARTLEVPGRVLDISAGDKWDVLCPFLGVAEPDVEFPWENKRR